MNNVIIVSAFIKISDDKFEKYITNGKKLLSLPIYKVVFIDTGIIHHFKEFNGIYNLIIPESFENIYLYKYRECVNNSNIVSNQPTKDTLDYFIIQCNKTEWVRRAILLKPFDNQFVWVDFGIHHILKENETFNFDNIVNSEYDKVRIPTIWELDKKSETIFTEVQWYFCGGLFGGHKHALIKFADLVKEKCIHLVENKKKLIWEVNIWYLVYLENKELFNTYNADHDSSMMSGYSKPENSDWTLVTAYFNLGKSCDASKEIIERDSDYYFSHSISTLQLKNNMVIYCDQESMESIQKIRLRKPTVYIIRDFENFSISGISFTEYRQIIKNNRIKNPYNFDNRNTPSYYLFCISRYIMLMDVIKENPFKSTHFAWINFCMERMGMENIHRLPEALSVYRDKFSTCYIDYIPEKIINNTPEYFLWGRCGMCSGFFTGNTYYMYKVCQLIIEKFLYYLKLGYGHADEQLYSPVYFENPELFEHYYGDYNQMITNYKHCYQLPENIIHNFITNSFNCGHYIKCQEACKFILKSPNLSNHSQAMYYYTESSCKIINIKISNEILDNFKLINHQYLVESYLYDFLSGQQEYRLYSYLSTFFNDCVILDIGTNQGRSAIALSYNQTNKIISYDITNQIENDNHIIYSKNNIQFKIKNVLDDLNSDFIKNIKIIMIDIDHYGNIEKDIINKLKELRYTGIILLDDIHHPDDYMKKCMEELWESITLIKTDITKYGHYSGTGLINMSHSIVFEFI